MPRVHICSDISSSSMRLVYGMSENSSKNKCQKSRMKRKRTAIHNVHPIIPHIILENRMQIWYIILFTLYPDRLIVLWT